MKTRQGIAGAIYGMVSFIIFLVLKSCFPAEIFLSVVEYIIASMFFLLLIHNKYE